MYNLWTHGPTDTNHMGIFLQFCCIIQMILGRSSQLNHGCFVLYSISFNYIHRLGLRLPLSYCVPPLGIFVCQCDTLRLVWTSSLTVPFP